MLWHTRTGHSRRQKTWTAEMDACSNQLIERALKLNVKLEKNYSSMEKKKAVLE